MTKNKKEPEQKQEQEQVEVKRVRTVRSGVRAGVNSHVLWNN